MQKFTGRGLPQGPEPSHFLAQLFLYLFDLKMIDKGYPAYYRYVDDIYVFSNDERNINECKAFIDREFKSLGLVMNSEEQI
ncbi:MAG: hypothetical protein CM15mP112_00010 [Flavobacteriales bacterium]|nr:MAG: hypothetical protein CM15mP112_00010 [Flavobacteriales bacterium]